MTIARRPIASIAQVDGLQGALDDRPDVGPRAYYLDAYNDFFGGATGAHPDARWTNTSHLTHDGLVAWAAFVVASQVDGEYIITGTAPKVVWLGDSWIEGEPAVLAAAVTARIAGATVVVSGVGGDKSTDLIARFDASVPADADYVIINEPGVNDVYAYGTTHPLSVVTANLETLVTKIRALGAVPIVIGPPPLVDHPTWSSECAAAMEAIMSSPLYPAVNSAYTSRIAPPYVAVGGNLGLGVNAASRVTTGLGNVAVGAMPLLSTGNNNTAVGNSALNAMAATNGSTAVGQAALYAATAAANTAVGNNALFHVTTGSSNTAIGYRAGYSATYGTTTGANNTMVGSGAVCGQASSYGTALGSDSRASSYNALAIGKNAVAAHQGSVAIGCDSTNNGAATTANNDFVLGVASHHVRVPGKLTVAGVVKSLTAATAGRPAANTAGAGAMMYDTTISKPIWSDGTTWRDAAGTEV